MKKILFPVLVSLSLVLAGCARKPEPVFKDVPYKVRTVKLAQVKDFQVRGVFSVQNTATQKSIIANYNWWQQLDKYQIRLSSSLGFFSATITGDLGHVTFQQSRKKIFSAKTPEALMQQQMGWSIPITNLEYWMRGLLAPGKHHASKFDQYGHLIHVDQQGWQVRLTNYQIIDGVDLPGRINLSNPPLNIRIIIKKWQA